MCIWNPQERGFEEVSKHKFGCRVAQGLRRASGLGLINAASPGDANAMTFMRHLNAENLCDGTNDAEGFVLDLCSNSLDFCSDSN